MNTDLWHRITSWDAQRVLNYAVVIFFASLLFSALLLYRAYDYNQEIQGAMANPSLHSIVINLPDLQEAPSIELVALTNSIFSSNYLEERVRALSAEKEVTVAVPVVPPKKKEPPVKKTKVQTVKLRYAGTMTGLDGQLRVLVEDSSVKGSQFHATNAVFYGWSLVDVEKREMTLRNQAGDIMVLKQGQWGSLEKQEP